MRLKHFLAIGSSFKPYLETTLGVLRQASAVEPNLVSLIYSFPLTCHSKAGLRSSPVASTIEDTEEESDNDGMLHLPSFLFPFFNLTKSLI